MGSFLRSCDFPCKTKLVFLIKFYIVFMEIRRGLRFNHTKYLPLSKARHQPGTTAIHHAKVCEAAPRVSSFSLDNWQAAVFFSLSPLLPCPSISDQELAFSLLCPSSIQEWKKGPMCRLPQNTAPFWVWFLSLNQGKHVFLIFFKPPDFTSLTTVLANHAIYILF